MEKKKYKVTIEGEWSSVTVANDHLHHAVESAVFMAVPYGRDSLRELIDALRYRLACERANASQRRRRLAPKADCNKLLLQLDALREQL